MDFQFFTPQSRPVPIQPYPDLAGAAVAAERLRFEGLTKGLEAITKGIDEARTKNALDEVGEIALSEDSYDTVSMSYADETVGGQFENEQQFSLYLQKSGYDQQLANQKAKMAFEERQYRVLKPAARRRLEAALALLGRKGVDTKSLRESVLQGTYASVDAVREGVRGLGSDLLGIDRIAQQAMAAGKTAEAQGLAANRVAGITEEEQLARREREMRQGARIAREEQGKAAGDELARLLEQQSALGNQKFEMEERQSVVRFGRELSQSLASMEAARNLQRRQELENRFEDSSMVAQGMDAVRGVLSKAKRASATSEDLAQADPQMYEMLGELTELSGGIGEAIKGALGTGMAYIDDGDANRAIAAGVAAGMTEEQARMAAEREAGGLPLGRAAAQARFLQRAESLIQMTAGEASRVADDERYMTRMMSRPPQLPTDRDAQLRRLTEMSPVKLRELVEAKRPIANILEAAGVDLEEFAAMNNIPGVKENVTASIRLVTENGRAVFKVDPGTDPSKSAQQFAEALEDNQDLLLRAAVNLGAGSKSAAIGSFEPAIESLLEAFPEMNVPAPVPVPAPQIGGSSGANPLGGIFEYEPRR